MSKKLILSNKVNDNPHPFLASLEKELGSDSCPMFS